MIRPFILSLTSALVACPLYAQDGLRVSLSPMPWHVQGEASAVPPLDAGPGAVTATDSLVYSNTHYGYFEPPAWFPAGAGVTVADDVHMIMPGRVTQFFFFYNEPVSILVEATVSIYANAGDGSVGRLLAGPYAFGPYRWGAYRVHASFNQPVPLEADLWFAVSFSSASAGLVMANPPFTGTSEPTYYDFTQGRTAQLYNSQGPVPANFYLQIYVDPEPVAVAPATWSQVKALYHPAIGARRD